MKIAWAGIPQAISFYTRARHAGSVRYVRYRVRGLEVAPLKKARQAGSIRPYLVPTIKPRCVISFFESSAVWQKPGASARLLRGVSGQSRYPQTLHDRPYLREPK